jgi:hypothetical protein
MSLVLAGCGEQAAIENAVRANLRDPDSSQFRNLLVSKHKTLACVEWNSKNSFGGYGDWDVARLKNDGKGWNVQEMQLSSENMSNCAQESMDKDEAAQENLKFLLEYK